MRLKLRATFAIVRTLRYAVHEQGTNFGRLRLVLFPRSELTKGLDYVRQRAYLFTSNDGEQPLTLSATGVGSSSFGKLISATLNVT